MPLSVCVCIDLYIHFYMLIIRASTPGVYRWSANWHQVGTLLLRDAGGKNYPLPTHFFHQKSEHRKSTWCCPKGWYSQYTWSSHWVLGPFPERQHPASCTIPPPAWDCTPSPGLGPPRCTAAGARSLHPWSARRRSWCPPAASRTLPWAKVFTGHPNAATIEGSRRC